MLSYLELIFCRRGPLPMTAFIFPWGARCGEQVLCTGKRQCLFQQSHSAPVRQHWVQLRMAHFGMASTTDPACQPCPSRLWCVWGCTAGSLWSPAQRGKDDVLQQAPGFHGLFGCWLSVSRASQGKRKMHQFHVDSSQKMNFPPLSLEEWNASVMTNRALLLLHWRWGCS